MANIKQEIIGIKCDYCDWVDNTVSNEELEKWLNKPCPKCDNNLLTENDYNNTLILNKTIDYFNSLSEKEINSLKNEIINNPNLMDDPTIQKLLNLDEQNISIDVNTHGEISFDNIKPLDDK